VGGCADADPKTDCCVRIKLQAQTRVAGGATKGLIPIGYKNIPFRNGRYFLPTGYANRPTPVMVLLHGAGDYGASMVNAFQKLAEKYR
jgi:poly(3-hydroxybutyrate) depolymerase